MPLKRLKRLAHLPIWRYADETSPEILCRQGRRAELLAGLSLSAVVLTCSALLEMLLSEPGWWSTLWIWISIAAAALALLMFLPGVLSHFWLREVARDCRARGISGGPDEPAADLRIRLTAMKVCAYSVALLVVVNGMGRWTALRPVACVLAAVATGWSLGSVIRKSENQT
jgi:phosphatidylglycerophosphate synthase